MQFTDIFIHRPVFASVLSLAILLVGIISYTKLPLRQFPKIDATTVAVSTTYPGASPQLMESFVTTPIESAIAGVEGLDYITSKNTQGTSRIIAHFKLGYNINTAVADIVNKVSSVRYQLPREINDPVIEKEDPNANPILFISFTDPDMSAVQINDYLTRTVKPILETVTGVGQAKIFGDLQYAMRIWLNPHLMASKDITAADVANALKAKNIQSPTGRLKNATQEFDTRLDSSLSTTKQFNNLVVRNEKNNLIRVKDIGYAKLATPERRVLGFINGETTNVIGIIPRSNANPLTVAKKVKQELKKIQGQFPKGFQAKVVWNNAKFIASSIKEVQRTIFEAVIFVILVIFLFLGSLRAILIPAVTIPLSLIGVCGLMFAMGYSLNTLTFLAFVLAIGMVVDDAIVVSENIHRQIELGHSRLEAALIGAREIRFAVIAMTLTLAAVYAPIIFMHGLTGALFKEFAFTLAATVIISGFVALTLSPMMCSKVLSEKGQAGRFEHIINVTTDKLKHGYTSVLALTLNYRSIIACVITAVIISCYFLFTFIPSTLAPSEDMGGILILASGPAAANLQYTEKYVREASDALKTIPAITDRLMIVGIPHGVDSAFIFAKLKNWSQRKLSAQQIIKELFPKLNAIPGIRAFPINPFRLPGAAGLLPVDFVVKTTGSYQQLNQVVKKIEAQAKKNPNLANVDTDLKIDKPQIDIKVNRNLAADLGVSVNEIGSALNIALGEPEFNRFELRGRSYYVIPQLLPQYRNSPQALKNLYVRGSSDSLVPLASLINLKDQIVPRSLNHFQQMRAAKIQASPAPGHTLGEALDALEKIAKKVMPPDMTYDFAGQSRQYVDESGTLAKTVIFAVLFIFLVLAAQFESFIDPIIVLVGFILSTFGALLLLKLSGGSLNIYTKIGLVTLIGLISKHGILMVEFANQLQTEGKNKKEAIITAASIRLRPILMTTAAMILGALPLALATGAGAAARNQIGIVIIGGMAFGTLLTLFVTPTVYTWLATTKLKA